jgi:hypothetical protein
MAECHFDPLSGRDISNSPLVVICVSKRTGQILIDGLLCKQNSQLHNSKLQTSSGNPLPKAISGTTPDISCSRFGLEHKSKQLTGRILMQTLFLIPSIKYMDN